jgi:putative endonuclease
MVKVSLRQYYVYILANKGKMLYTGITNDLERRVREHRNYQVDGYTRKYYITKLVYYEETANVLSAIAREKQIKGWLRKKKVDLIESTNPDWQDLSEDWYN